MSIGQRLACLAVVAMVFLSVPSATAWATDYAVGSDAASIKVDQAIQPGQTVTLPVFGIYNKGTKPANYEMTAVAVGKTDGIDPSWVKFDPRTFGLNPGGVTKVKVTVLVPSGARAGTYKALLAARIVDPGGSGVKMSVGIGPMLTVQVAKGWWLSAAWHRVADFFQGSAPWSYFGGIVAVLAILAVVLTLLGRKSRRLSPNSRSGGSESCASESGGSKPGLEDPSESAAGQA